MTANLNIELVREGRMRKTAIHLLVTTILLSTSLTLSATITQRMDDRAWLKWSKKEAEKILNDSGWSRVEY